MSSLFEKCEESNINIYRHVQADPFGVLYIRFKIMIPKGLDVQNELENLT